MTSGEHPALNRAKIAKKRLGKREVQLFERERSLDDPVEMRFDVTLDRFYGSTEKTDTRIAMERYDYPNGNAGF